MVNPVIIPELSPVAATHQTAQGEIAVNWTCADSVAAYAVTIPTGTTGTFSNTDRFRTVVLNGVAITSPTLLQPGTHHFTLTLN